MTNDQADALAWLGLEGTIPYEEQVEANPNFENEINQNVQSALQSFPQNCP
ncbi:hypothetical protein GO491_00865 [Flavobacteriaceae bacterium Ap0902]|nr:hypothetical protein [Flavobacteriaceae bacterium Ap0902]